MFFHLPHVIKLFQSTKQNGVYVAIETGGTTIKVAVVPKDNPFELVQNNQGEYPKITIYPTESNPQATIQKICQDLQRIKESILGIGIASFGPVELRKTRKYFGYITSTPKPGWQYFNIVGAVREFFPKVRIEFETDVNAPAIREYQLLKGLRPNVKNVAYITVGTGVGVGLVINGYPVHGMLHPEAGHCQVPIHPIDIQNNFPGTCPFHGQCVEGMVNSISLAKRNNCLPKDLKLLSDESETWEIFSHYISHLICNLILTTAVECVILGGGVLTYRPKVIQMIRIKIRSILNEYIDEIEKNPDIYGENLEHLVKLSSSGANAGIIGAIALVATD